MISVFISEDACILPFILFPCLLCVLKWEASLDCPVQDVVSECVDGL